MIKSKTKGRILSLLTVLAMLAAVFPTVPAFADSAEYGAFTVTGDDLTGVSYDSNLLTISSSGEYTIYQTDGTGTAITDTIAVTAADGDVTIMLAGVNIASTSASPFLIDSNSTADVTVKLSGDNTLDASSASGYAGLQKDTGTAYALTITSANNDDENDMLTATGGYYSAAIGGGGSGDGSNITINGGKIIANGGYYSAGIGGGQYSGGDGGDADNITINGGDVTATGGNFGVGIGGGYEGNADTITITGGTVTATGSTYGAGIGGGDYGAGTGGKGSNITITGGEVTAVSSRYGAGIGGGYHGGGESITIQNAVVTASSGYYGAGIGGGGGNDGNGSNITIENSEVTATGGQYGAGIGGGSNGTGSNITIENSAVEATGNYGAGIGGGYNSDGTYITIKGDSTVTATGTNGGAGIGGGEYQGAGSNIEITGGTVTAVGGANTTYNFYGAGIGGGYYGAGTDIKISGGYIKATAGNYDSYTADAIGGGYSATGTDGVTITGGYFGDSYASGQTTVYGVTPADGYAVYANDDDDTKDDYPCVVTETSQTSTAVYGAFTVTGDLTGVSYDSSLLTISAGGEYTIYQTDGTGTATSDTIAVTATDDVTITLAGVNISSSSTSPFNITGSGGVTIKLSNDNTLTSSGYNYAGLQKTSSGNLLTITSAAGDGNTDGSLSATGGTGAAGIGGGFQSSADYITISGGTIVATGAMHGAAIGGGGEQPGSHITITGGNVTATNSYYGAGIGGGSVNSGNGSYITITGGTVKASSGSGAGIGGGLNKRGSNIEISGGYIIASSSSGSAIGGGNGGSSSNISITGGYFGTGSVSAHTVYGIAVADDYYVFNSYDDTYPYLVSTLVETTAGDFKVATASNYADRFSYDSNVLTISGGGDYTISMADTVSSTDTDKIAINTDATTAITLSDVNITSDSTSPITVSGSANVTLTLDGDNVLTSTAASAINSTGSGTLTIAGDGGLTASGSSDAISGDNITITGGYYADENAVVYTSSNGSGTVYGITPASGYVVFANTDSSTNSAYPCYVGEYTNEFWVTTENSDGYTYADNLLNITESGEYTISMTTSGATATSDTIKITAEDGDVTITLDGVSVATGSTSPFEIDCGDAANTITIALSGENTLDAYDSSDCFAGLQKTSTENTLVITSASGNDDDDTLTATGSENGAAGIGGGAYGDGRNITINSGTVMAYGYYGAGIGGGPEGDGSDITINGGTVTVTGYDGAGIGGGFAGGGSDITINDGTVTAIGYFSAGIGGGAEANGSNIIINGGTVTAAGLLSAGIGGGVYGDGSNITITAGTVTAYGYYGAGIGGGAGDGQGYGYDADGSDITISGGTVTVYGYYGSAGIGGGICGNGSDIEISDGTVTAIADPYTSGYYGAGIGGGICIYGYGGSGTGIKISGGNITASADTTYAEIIGNGGDYDESYAGGDADVTITGGYFGDSYASGQTTVYGVTPASGYAVYANTDSETSTTYPCYVGANTTGINITGSTEIETTDENGDTTTDSGTSLISGDAVDALYKEVAEARANELMTEYGATGVTASRRDVIAVQSNSDGTYTINIEPYIIYTVYTSSNPDGTKYAEFFDLTGVEAELAIDLSGTSLAEAGTSVLVTHYETGGDREYFVTDVDGEYKANVITTAGFSTWEIKEFDGDKVADTINVEFEQIDDSNQYYIKLIGEYADDTGYMWRFSTAQLKFVFDDALDITEIGALSISAADEDYSDFISIIDEGDGEYVFKFNGGEDDNGNEISDITAHEVILGIATITGVGEFELSVDADYETNQVQTAEYSGDVDANTKQLVDNNIVRTYATDTDIASDDSELVIDYNTASGTLSLTPSKLTINVVFPNAVSDQSADYTKMSVKVTGLDKDGEEHNFGGTQSLTDITYSNNGEEDETLSGYNGYSAEVDVYQNYAYQLEFSGDGYRTYRTTIIPTGDTATVTVWNNVMDSDMVVISQSDADSAVYETTTFLAGDIIADNTINLYDLSAVISYFGKTGLVEDTSTYDTYTKYDLNRDGKIDSKDIAMVLVSWDN